MSDGYDIRTESTGVVCLQLRRPAQLNALDDALLRALPTALRGIAEDTTVRALVITGDERAFCSGGDLADLQPRLSRAGIEGTRQHMVAYHDVVRALQQIPIPVVAAVERVCAGAGISLMCAADIVVAGKSTTLTSGFAKAGLVPDLGALHFWVEAMGPRLAKEFAMLAEPMPAQDAQRVGLINRIVDDGTALPASLDIAEKLARGPAAALSMIKSLVNSMMAADRDATLSLEAFAQAAAFRTGEVDEGVAAFREKRPAEFGGRHG